MTMNRVFELTFAALLVAGAGSLSLLAQTSGTAKLQAKILDYTGSSGADHYTVAWVTTESGKFIKSLRKQGPSSWTSKEWGNHCGTWNTARAGSTVLDGYTSATARNYSGTNSPVILTWDGRDASGLLMPDGNYKFWVQYAENSGQGPVTTGGLLWTKGGAGATNAYPNQGVNFANMSVTWTPVGVPPTITSAVPPATGTVGVPYAHTVTATGTAPITFSASGLPLGLELSPAGAIFGVPTTPGNFNGAVTAANGVDPDDTQPFTIVISLPEPPSFGSFNLRGDQLVVGGTGPAGAVYEVLTTSEIGLAAAQWTVIATNTFDTTGAFGFTNSVPAGAAQTYYRVRLP